MIIPPRGVGFDLETATELDDEFFTSDPAAYFGARLATLLTDAPQNGPRSALATAVGGALEPGCLDQVLNVDKRERELQVAIDAFALRHHVAESLVRLYHGLAVAAGPCTWARISEGPYKTNTLVKACRTHLFSEAGRSQFWTLILPVSVAAEPESERISLQLNVAADWLRYAMQVLDREDINLGTAHNRMKHGFAVRANDDLLVTLTAQAPAPDGSMPLSALTEPQGRDIVAGPTLHYLSQARVAKREQGWEFNTVNLHPHLRLAEASMMITHSARCSILPPSVISMAALLLYRPIRICPRARRPTRCSEAR